MLSNAGLHDNNAKLHRWQH